METTYILFKSGGLYFLIPLGRLSMVKALESALELEIPVRDFGVACHLREKPAKNPYVLVLSLNGNQMGVAVELVEGIREIEEKDFYKLGEPVIGEKNKYLDSAAPLETLKPPLAYRLDMEALFKKLADDSQAQPEQQREGKRE